MNGVILWVAPGYKRQRGVKGPDGPALETELHLTLGKSFYLLDPRFLHLTRTVIATSVLLGAPWPSSWLLLKRALTTTSPPLGTLSCGPSSQGTHHTQWVSHKHLLCARHCSRTGVESEGQFLPPLGNWARRGSSKDSWVCKQGVGRRAFKSRG